MLRQVLRSKIQNAVITHTELEYEGSITLDGAMLRAADLMPGEVVLVVNLNNGERLETYVIEGEVGCGTVCLNGPTARKGYPGDRVHILAFAWAEPEEAAQIKPRLVALQPGNRVPEA
jgi:aspartate 1-decarboxylase